MLLPKLYSSIFHSQLQWGNFIEPLQTKKTNQKKQKHSTFPNSVFSPYNLLLEVMPCWPLQTLEGQRNKVAFDGTDKGDDSRLTWHICDVKLVHLNWIVAT